MFCKFSFYFSYEGTGRSLSLKLIYQLRQQSSTMGAAQGKQGANSKTETTSSATGQYFTHISMA